MILSFLIFRDTPHVARLASIVRLPSMVRLTSSLCAISLSLFLASTSVAQESYLVKLEEQGLITLDATNVPLGTLLQALSRRVPFEIRGGVAPDERVSVQFSRLSLKEALGKMIRNYNYVLVMPEGSEKPVLTIINPITRAPAREEPPPVTVTQGGTGPAPPQGAPPAPGRVPGMPGVAPQDADPSRPTVQERAGVPRTVPPGMQSAPPMPMPGPAPGPLTQPRPQQGAPETTGEKEAPPTQESMPSAVPETVMTPFGFRSVTPPETNSPSGTGTVPRPAGMPGMVAPGAASSPLPSP